MPSRILTDKQERELVQLYQQGTNTLVLAKSFGISRFTIYGVLKRCGVKAFRIPVAANNGIKKQISVESESQIIQLYESGLSARQIAAKIGCVSSTVLKVFKRNNVVARPVCRYRILNFNQRTQVVDEYIKGATYQQLATKYDVSTDTIGACLKEFYVEPRTGWGKFKTAPWTDRKGEIHIFKSNWELLYAKYLDENSFDWNYEASRFPLVKCRVYTPDFVIYSNDHVEYHEIKGWLDERTEDRLTEFVQTYSVNLRLIGPLDMVKLGLVEEKYMFHPMASKVNKFKTKLLSTAYCGRRIENARHRCKTASR